MADIPEVILLCGFSGSGKTETGQILAQRLDYGFVDTDEVVEESLGKSIPEIFAMMGEAKFRFAESDVVRMAVINKPHVISLGGGTIDDENNLKYIKHNGFLVYLKVSPETVFERLQKSHVRPMLQSFAVFEATGSAPDIGRIQSLIARREKYYSQADLVIDTENKSPEEVASEIKGKLSQDGSYPEDNS